MNLGFALVGRPEGMVTVSSGLFKKNNLADNLYLSGLLNGVNLESGEIIAVIKQIKEPNVWIVSLFLHANSFTQDRPGGFVGAAVCFRGIPKVELITKKLFELFKLAQSEVDENSKFKRIDFSDKQAHIQIENEKNFLELKTIPLKADFKSSSRAVLKVGVPFPQYLWSVVQSVLLNPKFNSFEFVAIGMENSVLRKIADKEFSYFDLPALLDYSEFHTQESNKLKSLSSKNAQEMSSFEERREQVKAEFDRTQKGSEDLKKFMQSQEVEIKRLNEKKESTENDIQAKNRKLTQVEEEIKVKSRELNKTEKDIQNIQKSKRILFKEHVENGPLKNILIDYVSQKIKNERDRIKEEIRGAKRLSERQIKTLKNAAQIFGAAVFLFLLCLSIWFVIKQVRHLITDTKAPTENTFASSPKDEDETSENNYKIVEPIPSSSQDKLGLQEWRKRELAVYDYVLQLTKGIKENNLDTAQKNIFLTRKINFKEMDFQFEEGNEFPQLEAYFNLLKELGVSDPEAIFSGRADTQMFTGKPLFEDGNSNIEKALRSNSFFLGVDCNKIDFTTKDFKTDKRAEILEAYLKLPESIYRFDERLTLEPKDSLLIEHFRWMIFTLSEHDDPSSKDLNNTKKTTHRIPIIKK